MGILFPSEFPDAREQGPCWRDKWGYTIVGMQSIKVIEGVSIVS